mgnify:CR=1 FL=1
MPVHCMAHHHHQLGFFSTPTPIKDSVGDDGGEEACSAGRAAGGAVLFDLTATSILSKRKKSSRDRDIGRSTRLCEIRMNEARPYL